MTRGSVKEADFSSSGGSAVEGTLFPTYYLVNASLRSAEEKSSQPGALAAQ